MPINITERYKTDEEFREKMKANSRKRYAEIREALGEIRKRKAASTPPPAPPPSSTADQTKPLS